MANKSNVSIKFSGNAVTTGVALVIIGVLFCILQGAAVQALITTLGVLFILMGAIDLMHKNWVVGAIELAVGIVVIVCTNLRAQALSAKSQSFSCPFSSLCSAHCLSLATGKSLTNFSSQSARLQSHAVRCL